MANILSQIGGAVNVKLAEKLNLAGGTITGELVVPAPTAETQVAQKAQISALEAAIGSYGNFVATIADVTVSVSDTAANILATASPANGTVAVATDTNAIYVADGGVFSLSTIDTVNAAVITALAEYNASGDTEANIRLRTSDATGTIMFGTDTYDLYIFDGTDWQTYNNDA